MGAPYFFQIQDCNTQANLCKNNFYPATIKNDNGSFATRFVLCGANGTNNSIKLKKDDVVEYNNF